MNERDKITQLLDACEMQIDRQLTADGQYYSTSEATARGALLTVSKHLAVISHLLEEPIATQQPANHKIMAIKVVRDVTLRGEVHYSNETIMPAGQPQPSRHYLGLADCKAVVEALIAAGMTTIK
jgi:hypothetical protein